MDINVNVHANEPRAGVQWDGCGTGDWSLFLVGENILSIYRWIQLALVLTATTRHDMRGRDGEMER